MMQRMKSQSHINGKLIISKYATYAYKTNIKCDNITSASCSVLEFLHPLPSLETNDLQSWI